MKVIGIAQCLVNMEGEIGIFYELKDIFPKLVHLLPLEMLLRHLEIFSSLAEGCAFQKYEHGAVSF